MLDGGHRQGDGRLDYLGRRLHWGGSVYVHDQLRRRQFKLGWSWQRLEVAGLHLLYHIDLVHLLGLLRSLLDGPRHKLRLLDGLLNKDLLLGLLLCGLLTSDLCQHL